MTTTEPTTAPPTLNTAALRLARTPMDMAKAVLVLLIPVIVLVAIYIFFFGGSNVIVIDPSGTYSEARASAKFTVLEPTGLSSGWKPVSSSFKIGPPSTLRVGYIAPDGAGIQLVESDQDAHAFITAEVGDIAPVSASVQAGGRTWGLVSAANSAERALVGTESGRTLIILGPDSATVLEQFATTLH